LLVAVAVVIQRFMQQAVVAVQVVIFNPTLEFLDRLQFQLVQVVQVAPITLQLRVLHEVPPEEIVHLELSKLAVAVVAIHGITPWARQRLQAMVVARI
jgi:hypothetical protein